MLTLIEEGPAEDGSEDKVYYMTFGRKIKLLRNSRVRDITFVIVTVLRADGSTARILKDMRTLDGIEEELKNVLHLAEFNVDYETGIARFDFDERDRVNIAGETLVLNVDFHFVLRN